MEGGDRVMTRRDCVRFLALARFHSSSYADRYMLAQLIAAQTASLPACEHVTLTALRDGHCRPDEGKK